jgi:c-di-GMP-binding flagellar brake protein YcgR
MLKWMKKGRPEPAAAGQPARPESERAGRARERRRDSRLIEENKVSIERLSGGRSASEKMTLNALTKDISPGGVRLVTRLPLPDESLLMMEIVLSGLHRVVRAMGAVRWSRSVAGEEMFESGVEFTQISPEDKMLLLEHTYKKRKKS